MCYMEIFKVCSLFLFACFCIQEAHFQVAVYQATSRPFCEKSIELRCNYSGSSGCCSVTPRVWRLDGSQIIMSNGAGTSSRYTEVINTAASYFSLVISDTNSEDFGKEYTCVYDFSTSQPFTLTEDDEKRGECAGKDFGCATIGTVIAIIIILIIACILLKNKLHVVVVVVVSFFISEAVNALIAVPIGYFVAHCNCKPGLEYTFILLGLATAGVPGAILIFYKNRCGESTSESQTSCWLPCSVGPEPEKQTNRSPKIAHKTEKPVGVTRPQPAKPPAQNVRTDNESNLEMVPKGRPLPPLTSQWPQPTLESDEFPQKRALPPLTSTAEPVEKKKKKKKKKKLDEEDNDD